MFENMSEEMMRYCRKLHNLELHNRHSVPSIIRGSKRLWVGYVACILGKNTNICGISIEEVEGQRSPERCSCRLEDNAKVNLEKWDMRRV